GRCGMRRRLLTATASELARRRSVRRVHAPLLADGSGSLSVVVPEFSVSPISSQHRPSERSTRRTSLKIVTRWSRYILNSGSCPICPCHAPQREQEWVTAV